MIAADGLIDGFGRLHDNLRISVTDRCNIRCFYCMPAEHVRFLPRKEILSFEEITRFVNVAAGLGVTKLRLTGGEPLVRHDLPRLIAMLRQVHAIRDIALTTNGILLAEQARDLLRAGLDRVNISLDALDRETFQLIARRDEFDRVLAGIFAARNAGFANIKINAVAIRGITEPHIVSLGRFAREHGLELRFIEYMPLDAEGGWRPEQVLSGDEIRRTLEDEFGDLIAAEWRDPAQPAVDYEYADGAGRVGFINPVTQAFCHRCNRLRLTAEGQVRNCLFSTVEWDARKLLRSGGTDEQLADLIRACVGAKRASHGIGEADFIKPERAMYQIGG